MKIVKSYIGGIKMIQIQPVHEAKRWARTIFNIERLKQGGEYPNFRYSHDMWFDRAQTYRGCYFQLDPMDYEMLVYCPKGRMLVISVDIRKHSKTFKKYSVIEISDKNMKQVYTKRGIAHAFISLEDDTYAIIKSDLPITQPHYHRVMNLWKTCDIVDNFSQYGVDSESLIVSVEDLLAPALEEIEGFYEQVDEIDEPVVEYAEDKMDEAAAAADEENAERVCLVDAESEATIEDKGQSETDAMVEQTLQEKDAIPSEGEAELAARND